MKCHSVRARSARSVPEKSKQNKRQQDNNWEEQNNKKKRKINIKPKLVDEKLIIDISDNQFKKRKQSNTEKRDEEERRLKWKSHHKPEEQ